ncbi:hypothetical protein TNCV_3542861 [Trichonephila clavipes]|nr:hypothetical protein TNCV_3542861 [Trichonephila clavipes]
MELARKEAEEYHRERKQELEFARIEARWKTEKGTRIREARYKEKMEAKLKAEEEARFKTEEEARLKAEEEARLKAEEEARLKAEEERQKIEEERRMNERIALEEEMRLKKEAKAVEERRKIEERRMNERIALEEEIRWKERWLWKSKCDIDKQEKLSDEDAEVPQAIEKVLLFKSEQVHTDAVAQPLAVEEGKENTPVDVRKDKAEGDIDPVILNRERVDLDNDEIEEEKPKLCE